MTDFAAARDRIRAIVAADAANPEIDPRGYPRFYEHGEKTARSIVLFHGLTNCPQQFEAFAQQLHADGANVYVPRLPYHGYADKRTRAIGAMTAADVRHCADEAAELAHALGERVAVAGLSLGATMALWLAQEGRADNAIGIAPFLMVPFLPRGPGMLLMRLLDWLPNGFMWWDPRVKERVGPSYAYPGFWTHCLAQCVFAGAAIFSAAAKAKPAAAACTIVVNANDPAINDAVALELSRVWRERSAPYTYLVWDDLGKRHDVIDLTTFPAAATLVYPRLAALLNETPA